MGTWSRDGRFVYLGSSRSGSRELWRVPAEAEPRCGSLTQEATTESNRRTEGLSTTPTARGTPGSGEYPQVAESRVDGRGPLSPENFALGARGLYYIEGRSGGDGLVRLPVCLISSPGRWSVFRREGPIYLRSLSVSPTRSGCSTRRRPCSRRADAGREFPLTERTYVAAAASLVSEGFRAGWLSRSRRPRPAGRTCPPPATGRSYRDAAAGGPGSTSCSATCRTGSGPSWPRSAARRSATATCSSPGCWT